MFDFDVRDRGRGFWTDQSEEWDEDEEGVTEPRLPNCPEEVEEDWRD